jgi:DNA-binding transcriptional MerR regulator
LTIKWIKSFGFTLNETSEFLELINHNNASCENVANKVYQKVSLIDEKIKELQEMKSYMLTGVNKCQNCCTEENTDNCLMLTTDDFLN